MRKLHAIADRVNFPDLLTLESIGIDLLRLKNFEIKHEIILYFALSVALLVLC